MMFGVIVFYIIIFVLMFPSIYKYKNKKATAAFFIMFIISFSYSLLSALDVPLDGVPLFFSRLLRDWGIKYPDL